MSLSKWSPSKVFYGWWIVGASAFIALYVAGAIAYGFTAIFEPIVDEMGWSYTQVSLAASLRGLETGLLAPLIGILVDRWGPRRLIFSGALIIAAGLMFLSRITSLAMFYGAFALIALGVSCCTMTTLMTTIANWFRQKMGMASGIAVAGFGFGGLLVPVVVRLVDAYDWRRAMTILAFGVLATVLPLSLLFRHRPEQYGYSPDGLTEDLTVTSDDRPVSPKAIEVSITPKQALKSSTFWRISLAFACYYLVLAAAITHVMPYLSSIGTARATSSIVATAIPLTSIAGRLSLAWLGDKHGRKRVLAVAFAMMAGGLLCFGFASTAGDWILALFLALFGAGYGGCSALRPSLMREYFGRANFGTVFGLLTGVTMTGTLAGPTLAGWAYDHWGSYQNIWLVFAVLPVVALFSILTIPSITTKAQPADMP